MRLRFPLKLTCRSAKQIYLTSKNAVHILFSCSADNCVVEGGDDIECSGVCGIDPLTGGPYCDTSCDINNGGCSNDEVCVRGETIFCIRFPCPQPIRCLPKPGKGVNTYTHVVVMCSHALWVPIYVHCEYASIILCSLSKPHSTV